jgi:hypothetical protein
MGDVFDDFQRNRAQYRDAHCPMSSFVENLYLDSGG